jgi:hypothetical protein
MEENKKETAQEAPVQEQLRNNLLINISFVLSLISSICSITAMFLLLVY